MVLAAPGIPLRGPSGAGAHFRGLVRAFHRRGLSVRVVCASEGQDHAALPVPVEVVTVPREGHRDDWEIAVAEAVRDRALAGPRAALVLERWTLFSDAGAQVAEAWGVPSILEVNAPMIPERERFDVVHRPIRSRLWQRRTLQASSWVYAVSPWLVDWLAGLGVVARCIPNGTEALVGDRGRGRELLEVEAEDFVLGFLGKPKAWHGVEVLEELARELGGVARVVGEEQLDERDVADVVAAFDVGLAPYPAGAPAWFCPLKVAAYRAQGTPVVATHVGAMERWVGDGGSVCEPTLASMLEATRSWRGRRALPWLRSWDQVVDEILELAR
jgi:starch synthase